MTWNVKLLDTFCLLLIVLSINVPCKCFPWDQVCYALLSALSCRLELSRWNSAKLTINLPSILGWQFEEQKSYNLAFKHHGQMASSEWSCRFLMFSSQVCFKHGHDRPVTPSPPSKVEPCILITLLPDSTFLFICFVREWVKIIMYWTLQSFSDIF